MSDFLRLPYSKLFITAGLVSILIFSIVLSYTMIRIKSEALNSAAKIASLHTRTFEDHLSQHFNGIELTLKNIAQSYRNDQNRDQLDSYFYSALFNSPFLRSISIVDKNGKIIHSSAIKNIGMAIDTSLYYPSPFNGMQILRFGTLKVGRDFYDINSSDEANQKQDGLLNFFSALLEFKEDGEPFSVLATLNPSYFENYYLGNMRTELSDTTVVNFAGEQIISTALKKGEFINDVIRIADKKPIDTFMFTGKDSKDIVSFRSSKNFPFIVIVSLNHDEALKSWSKERNNILIVSVIFLVLFTLVLAFLFIRYQTQRLHILQEEALEKKRIKGLMDTVPDSLLMLDTEGNIIMSNAKWNEFMEIYFSNLKKDDIKNCIQLLERILDTSSSNNELISKIESVIKGDLLSQYIEYNFKHDSKDKYFSFFIHKISETNLVGSIVTQLDITDRKIAEIKLHKALEDLHIQVKDAIKRTAEQDMIIYEQRRHQALSNLIINIAHQWRQPLNVISLSANIIEDEVEQYENPNIITSINAIHKELKYLTDVISFFTETYEDNKESLESIDIARVFEEILKIFELRFKDQQIIVKKEIIENLNIKCSKMDFTEIFVQIIENVISIKNERSLNSATITIKTELQDGKVYISINDNIGGIAPEIIDHIFDPYTTTAFRSRHKGIGLYQIRRLLENKYNGTISALNNEDGGASIVISFG